MVDTLGQSEEYEVDQEKEKIERCFRIRVNYMRLILQGVILVVLDFYLVQMIPFT